MHHTGYMHIKRACHTICMCWNCFSAFMDQWDFPSPLAESWVTVVAIEDLMPWPRGSFLYLFRTRRDTDCWKAMRSYSLPTTSLKNNQLLTTALFRIQEKTVWLWNFVTGFFLFVPPVYRQLRVLLSSIGCHGYNFFPLCKKLRASSKVYFGKYVTETSCRRHCFKVPRHP